MDRLRRDYLTFAGENSFAWSLDGALSEVFIQGNGVITMYIRPMFHRRLACSDHMQLMLTGYKYISPQAFSV
jgi:hypothetical protein